MTIKIEHLAIWTADLEKVKDFYVKYFDMVCGEKYHNLTKNLLLTYFLSFKESHVRIELVHRPGILEHSGKKGITNGLTHFAISVGNKELVTSITRANNFIIESEPKTTGDGYNKSVVLDTEGNLIEIAA